jgi:hypothetical protein
MISVPKSDIEMIFNLLGAKLSNSSGSSTVKLNKSGKPKKQNSNKGKPTCHGDFVKMICEKMKDEVAAFKAANPDQKGAHLVFAANYKKENAEEVAAFEAKWKEEHPKDAVSEAGSSAGSVADDAEIASDASGSAAGTEKKKRAPMSDEQKAKMKAGREAAKAKKDAEKAGLAAPAAPETAPAPVAVAAPVPVAAPVDAAAAKKPVKTAKKAASVITTPVAAPIEAAAHELLPFKMGVVTYLRMGTKRPDGNHLWASGHIWNSKGGAKGPYVGELQDDGELDEKAKEPIV